jgi:hypothetical protein
MYKEITTILTDYISVVWNDGEREEVPLPIHIWNEIEKHLDDYEFERNKEEGNE